MDTCPICFKQFPLDGLELHVNGCLDSLEVTEEVASEEKDNNPETSEDVMIVGSSKNNSQPKNAFAALGLKMDSSERKKGSTRATKAGKSLSTLTSLLIAEKKLQGYGKGDKKKKKNKIKEEIKEMEDKERNNKRERVIPKEEKSSDNVAKIRKVDNAPPLIRPPINKVETSLKKVVKPATVEEESIAQLSREARLPLAQRLRPKTLDDFYGQEKLVGPQGLLRNMIEADNIPSFILWGVPGVGKTSLARIIALMTQGKFIEISGVDANSKRLKEVFVLAENEKRLTGRKTILFIDEIHRFNKAVQDLLLPVIEKGVATVIGATTENPSFNLNNALLSRMHTFTMEPMSMESTVKVINRGLRLVNRTRNLVHNLHLINLKRDAIDYIAKLSTGDSRVALNILESIHAYLSGLKYSQFDKLEEGEKGIKIPGKLGVITVSYENLKPLLSTRNYHQMYDKHGESHYDTISAFHKSVRGCDADASIFYLVKMLSGGEDPLFIARRMIVIASEDIGLRDSSCLPFAIAVKDALEFVGMPEGEIILAHCAAKLARASKSTKSYRALRNAQSLFQSKPELNGIPIPIHLRNAPTGLMKELGYGEDYKYPPNFEQGKVKQTYLPKEVAGTKFLEPTHLGTVADPDVPETELEQARQEEEDYAKFKEMRKLFMKERHSYDEFLSKADQPEFFDGEEKDQYSDDPDCTNNFECSYDEFLDKDAQPQYWDAEAEDTHHYDPEYPIFYSEDEQLNE